MSAVAAPVSVTLVNRIVSLDALRGIAVLGILIANIVAFAVPVLTDRQTVQLPTVSLDAWIEVVRQWLVAGKFRGMLAILFGVGLHMQFVKRSANQTWPKGYVRRTFFLAGIGLVHAILIWFGDILFPYACTALLALLFAKVADRYLLYWIAGLTTASLFIAIGLMGLMAMMGSMEGGSEASLGPLKQFLSEPAEIRTYQTGSYLDQILLRTIIFVVGLFQLFMLIPELLALFLVGMLLARRGFLAKPSAHPDLLRLGWIGLGIGLVLNAIPVIMYAAGSRFNFSFLIEFSFGAISAFGYLCLGAVLVERMPQVFRPVQNVGRMALTCYLLQSVLCTFFFYSWGLGWFARLSSAQMLLVIPVVWVIEIVFAWLWFQRFSIGPVERYWRMASEKRKIPWRVEPIEATTPPVA